MTLLVDTSVWSLTLRRDQPEPVPEVTELSRAFSGSETIVTTGLVLQEVLQGFFGPKARNQLLERFNNLPFLVPDRADHVEAAELRNRCRRGGVQIGTVDALLAQLCIRHGLTMLTSDRDFRLMTAHCALRVWPAPA